jgi:hypothetical protein
MLVLAALLNGQEGHPLVGSWHGNWGANAKDRTDVTVVMFWDGKEISGMLNPGLDSSKLQKATLDPTNWTVHFEADTKVNGAMVHVIADGKIENLTNVRRAIAGAWTQGNVKGDFRLTRDN